VREDVSHLENEFTRRLNEMREHATWSNAGFRKQIILDYDMLCFREASVGRGAHPEEMDDHPGLLLALRQKAILEAAQGVYAKLLENLRGVQAESGEFRGGTISRLRQLGRDFDLAADRLKQDASYFEQKYNEDLSLVLFEREDIGREYYPHCVKPESVKHLSDVLKDKHHLTPAAVKDTNFLKQEGASGVILDLCREEFERIRSDYHVVDVLFDRFDAAEDRDGRPVVTDTMARELSRVFSSSRFWAFGGANHMRNFQLEAGQEELCVGLPVVPPDALYAERTKRRRDAIKEFLGTKVEARFRFPDVPDTSEIIFYNDLSGVPLNFFDSMYELRETYRQLRAGDNALHLEAKDSSKFEDVLIMTDVDKARLERAMKCLVLGALYGELWVKNEDGKTIFGFSETVRAVEAHKRMGEEREAVNYLQQRTDVTDKMLGACEAKLDDAFLAAASNDPQKQGGARDTLVKIAAVVATRMQTLAAAAAKPESGGKAGSKTGDWTDLPLIPKMEYHACEELSIRIHERCKWNGFEQDVRSAMDDVLQFAVVRHDARHSLKPASVATAQR
jgi:hypothetical protein